MKKIFRNKKGVSEMVGYVLLIVIAISVSVMVYAYLRNIAIQPPEKCDEGVSLMIEDYNCNVADMLNLTIKNQGTLSVDGFMIHGSNESARWFAIDLAGKSTNGQILFEGDRLNASKSRNFIFSYGEHNSVNRLEIKPMQAGKTMIICENAIINQEIRGCN